MLIELETSGLVRRGNGEAETIDVAGADALRTEARCQLRLPAMPAAGPVIPEARTSIGTAAMTARLPLNPTTSSGDLWMTRIVDGCKVPLHKIAVR
jgi:hypothetical protein